MTDKKIRGIIVGAGFMGGTHLHCYAQMPDVEILGIVDKNKEKGLSLAAKQPQCKHFEDLEQAISECKPDFTDICLPTALHTQAAVTSLKGGVNVLVEKPFAVNTIETAKIIEEAKKAKKRVMVAHVCRFMNEYRYAKSVAESGKLGKPLIAVFCRESDTPLWSENNWLQNKKSSGGTILDLSIHDIDLANWLLGKPVDFSCFELESSRIPGASHVNSVISYAGGAIAYITANHLMPKGYPLTASYRIVFEKGSLEWNTVNCKKGHVAQYEENRRIDVAITEKSGIDDPYFIQLKSFVKGLATGEDFVISAEEAQLAVQTVNELDTRAKSLART